MPSEQDTPMAAPAAGADYWRKRERSARANAETASDPAIGRIHRELADHLARLAKGSEAA